MTRGTLLAVSNWSSRLLAAGILAFGAVPKFTGGASLLAERIPGGMTSAYVIGALEAAAIVLLLVPRTALLGSVFAAALMLGAIASHFGPVGFDGDFATLFALAIVALLAAGGAAATGLLRRRTIAADGLAD